MVSVSSAVTGPIMRGPVIALTSVAEVGGENSENSIEGSSKHDRVTGDDVKNIVVSEEVRRQQFETPPKRPALRPSFSEPIRLLFFSLFFHLPAFQ